MIEFLASSEGGIALLDVNPGLVVWTTVTFVLVLLLLNKFAWKPIIKALDDRADRIHSDIERANQLRNEADTLFQQYQNKLNDLKGEAQEMINEGRRDAEVLKNDILEKARKEAEEIRARSRKEIQLAMDSALEEIHRQAVDLSVEITKRVVSRNMTPEDHKKQLQEALESISRN
jgi:F-type H+-transporting ATPase subunit b